MEFARQGWFAGSHKTDKFVFRAHEHPRISFFLVAQGGTGGAIIMGGKDADLVAQRGQLAQAFILLLRISSGEIGSSTPSDQKSIARENLVVKNQTRAVLGVTGRM